MRTHLLLAATFGLGLPACGGGDSANAPSTDAAFACIGKIEAVVPTGPQVTISGVVREHLGSAPVADMKVTMCALSDPTCAAPIGTITTSGDGAVSFSVPTGTAGFDGFAKFEKSGYVRQLNFARPLVAASRAYEATMISTTAWAIFLIAAGVTEDAQRGNIALRALDCQGDTAAGISFALDRADARTTAAYVSALGIPTTGPATDASGRGVFLNVPPGPVMATATLAATGQKIGTLNFIVQAGFVSGLSFPPTP